MFLCSTVDSQFIETAHSSYSDGEKNFWGEKIEGYNSKSGNMRPASHLLKSVPTWSSETFCIKVSAYLI